MIVAHDDNEVFIEINGDRWAMDPETAWAFAAAVMAAAAEVEKARKAAMS